MDCFLPIAALVLDDQIHPAVVTGDRWLVQCLGCLYSSKGLFYRVVPADQGFHSQDDYAGIFRYHRQKPDRDFDTCVSGFVSGGAEVGGRFSSMIVCPLSTIV